MHQTSTSSPNTGMEIGKYLTHVPLLGGGEFELCLGRVGTKVSSVFYFLFFVTGGIHMVV